MSTRLIIFFIFTFNALFSQEDSLKNILLTAKDQSPSDSVTFLISHKWETTYYLDYSNKKKNQKIIEGSNTQIIFEKDSICFNGKDVTIQSFMNNGCYQFYIPNYGKSAPLNVFVFLFDGHYVYELILQILIVKQNYIVYEVSVPVKNKRGKWKHEKKGKVFAKRLSV